MAMKKGGDADDAIADINVVPLVDIILVVLIIFMVTAPMIMKPSLNVNLPKAASGEKSAQTLLNFTISVNGSVSLNGSAVDEGTIQSKSKEAATQNPDIQAVIAADKDVPHGTVVHILDLIKLSGVKRFAISIDQAK